VQLHHAANESRSFCNCIFIYRLFILRFRLRNSDHELIPVSVCIKGFALERLNVNDCRLNKKSDSVFFLQKPDLRPGRKSCVHSNDDIDILTSFKLMSISMKSITATCFPLGRARVSCGSLRMPV